ncbi:MAG: 4-hydroxy-tetrahydrodipicolinate reductase [Alphaproteobacteria bacterium]|nr:4-hydroxy-tetrahydrodipicolinate reductase [Alphaproteobacteria bacterium]
MPDTRIAVIGCAGRMGRMLVSEIVTAQGCSLAGGTVRPGAAQLGQDLGELIGHGRLGIPITDNPEGLLRDCDVAIDFTSPKMTAITAGMAAALGKPLVIGTTGLHAAEDAAVRDAAGRIAIVWAANTSLGINLLLGLVEQAALRLGPDWDIEIWEAHHKAKVDAPSGTALALGKAAAKARGVNLDDMAVRGRDGITGARKSGTIGFAALRGGDNIGEHHVIFAGAGEQLELTHRATNRSIYAKGAVRAAQWLLGRPPGLYGMKEVLGL